MNNSMSYVQRVMNQSHTKGGLALLRGAYANECLRSIKKEVVMI